MGQILDPENGTDTSMVPTDAYNLTTQTDYAELDATVDSMLEKNSNGKWTCNVCGKIDTSNNSKNSKQNMKTHIEGKHIEGVSHPCSQCGKSFRSRDSFRVHIGKFHKK
jgi:hypothetical protein